MNKVNRILTTNIKSGLVRDLDEEKFDMAYGEAYEQLKVELGETPTERAIVERAYEIITKVK